jgi:hypothetical protein
MKQAKMPHPVGDRRRYAIVLDHVYLSPDKLSKAANRVSRELHTSVQQ